MNPPPTFEKQDVSEITNCRSEAYEKNDSPVRNLIYTIVMDAPGAEGYRFLGKMLVSSLLRTFFTGDIVVFRNGEVPLFLVERKGLEEVFIETPPMSGKAGAEAAWCWKYRVAEMLDVRGYDKVMFLDADFLALRNIDHLLEGDWDIACQPERGRSADDGDFNGFYTDAELKSAGGRTGINSGSWAVRASCFHEVMRQWREIDTGRWPRRENGFRDQASWNTFLRRRGKGSGFGVQKSDAGEGNDAEEEGREWKVEFFPEGEIQFPMYLDPDYRSYHKAALTHNCGMNTLGKVEFSFGLYMRTFFCDPTGLFFSMLEM